MRGGAARHLLLDSWAPCALGLLEFLWFLNSTFPQVTYRFTLVLGNVPGLSVSQADFGVKGWPVGWEEDYLDSCFSFFRGWDALGPCPSSLSQTAVLQRVTR